MKKISSLKILSLMGGVMLLTTPQSHAATKTATMAVSVKVVGACTLTTNPLNFGSYDPVSTTDLTASTTVSVLCPNGQSYTVALDVGSSAGATFVNRKLINGTNNLNYNLYKDTGYTTVWGDGSGVTGTNGATSTNSTTATPYTVYGKIVAGQTTGGVSGTTLNDTVTVTLNY